MLPWTLREVAALTGGRVAKGDPETLVSGVRHDSRQVKRGDLFVAVVGEKFDGHKFLREASKKGAKGALVSKIVPGGAIPQVKVADTTRAFGELGRAQRLQWGGPLVAVTGSVGKTTVKDMTAHLLGGSKKVLKSRGNLNNQFGLPMTLLRLDRKTEVAVVELGINHPGEMEWLSEIARPDVAVVTAIGEAHLGFFRNKRHLAEEKMKIGRGLREKGTLVLNGDDPLLSDNVKNTITFGLRFGQVRARDVEAKGFGHDFILEASGARAFSSMALPGLHNVRNGLAAVSAGLALGVPLKTLASRLRGFLSGAPMRMEMKNVKGVLFMNDAYNASPTSMEAALETFQTLRGPGRKAVILGDMLEMGTFSKGAHQRIMKKVLGLGFEGVFLVGKKMKEALENQEQGPSEVRTFAFPAQAAAYLRAWTRKGDAVLLKASRGMRLEKILERF